jgi:hypothetical protein
MLSTPISSSGKSNNEITFIIPRFVSVTFKLHINIFLIRIVGGGVQLGPLGTSAINWSIVLAPGDYDDGEFGGMMIDRGNRSTRRKTAPAPLCLPQIAHDVTGREPGPPRWEASD